MKRFIAALGLLVLAAFLVGPVLADAPISALPSGGLVNPLDVFPDYNPTEPGQNFGVTFGSAAAYSVGTSGPDIPLLNTANSWSAQQSFMSGDLIAADADFIGGSITLPAGTASSRPSSPVNGMLRYNTTTPGFEGYVAGVWGPIGSGGGGGSFSLTSPGPGLVLGTSPWTGGTTTISLGPPGTSTYGAIFAAASASANQFLTYIDTSGAQHTAQVNFSNLGGTASNAQLPTSGVSAGSYTSANVTVNAQGIITSASNGSGGGGSVSTTGSPASGELTEFSGATTITNGNLSGDISTSGTLATTLATVNSNVGSFTNANITVNGKGLITAASNGSGGGGGMVYPGAGIANSTGSAWGTSYSLSGTGSTIASAAGATLTTTSVNGVTLSSTGSSSLYLNQTGGYSTPSGGGNVSGPGSSTNGYVPEWSGTSGTSLATGIAIGTTGATLSENSGNNTYSGNDIFSAAVKINLNATSLPTALTGTVLQAGNVDSTATRIEADSFGATAYHSSVRKDGTNASPTTLQSGDEIGGFNAFGYNGTAVVGPQASFRTYAAQNWSVGANGTYADVATTPNGSTTLTEGLKVDQNQNVLVPNGLVGIGSSSPNSSLDASQKTDAFSLPSGTSAQRPSGVNGMVRYNSSGASSVETYLDGAWNQIFSSAAPVPIVSGGNTYNAVVTSFPYGASGFIVQTVTTGSVTSGTTNIPVASSAGFNVGHIVVVSLAGTSGNKNFSGFISAIPDSTHITVSTTAVTGNLLAPTSTSGTSGTQATIPANYIVYSIGSTTNSALAANGATTLTLTNASSYNSGNGLIAFGCATSGANLVTQITNVSGNVVTINPGVSNASGCAANAAIQHDDTAAFQSALNLLSYNLNVNIFVPDGFYQINGNGTAGSSDPNMYLAVPAIQYWNSGTTEWYGMGTLQITGNVAAPQNQGYGIGSGGLSRQQQYVSGAILQSSGTFASILSTPYTSGSLNGMTSVNVIVKNLTMRTVPGSTLSDIYGLYFAGLRVIDSSFDTGETGSMTQPVYWNNNNYAIVGPTGSNGGGNIYSGVEISGAYGGVIATEHTRLERMRFDNVMEPIMIAGVSGANSYYGITGYDLDFDGCPHGIIVGTKYGGPIVLDISELNIEHQTSPSWVTNVDDIADPNNVLTGRVIIDTDDSPYVNVTDAINLKVINGQGAAYPFDTQTFSGLSSSHYTGAPNGTSLYCSNCTATQACAGSGTGAWATMINGSWSCTGGASVGGGSPGGSSTDVQFNSSGSLGGDSGFTYGSGAAVLSTSLTDPLHIGGTTASSTLTLESTSGTGTSDSILFKTGSQVTALTLATNQVATFGAGAIGATPYSPTISTSTFTPNFQTANINTVTLVHASCPCTIANPATVTPGETGTLYIIQSSTGSDTIGTWGSDYKFNQGVAPTLSSGASYVDELSYVIRDSTHIDVSLVGTYFH